MDVEPDIAGFIATKFCDLNGIFEIRSGREVTHTSGFVQFRSSKQGRCVRPLYIVHMLGSLSSNCFVFSFHEGPVLALCTRVDDDVHDGSCIVHMLVSWSIS